MSSFLATILGNPDFPSVHEVNVRSGAGLTNGIVFIGTVGMQGRVLAVAEDAQRAALNGKVYIWLNVRFDDGRTGWVRDDLIGVEGDGSGYGYGVVSSRTLAFRLIRSLIMPPEPVTPENPPNPSAFTAIILGIPTAPAIRVVNIRSGPALSNALLFTADLGVRGTVLAVENDSQNSMLNGKVYVWMQVRFDDRRTGWVRDDLIEVQGNGSAFGYGTVAQRTQAFLLKRSLTPQPQPEPVTPPEPQNPPAAGVFTAFILGNPDLPTITEVNVRSGPALTNALLFRVPLGQNGPVLAAEEDTQKNALNGKVYVWLQMRFSDGRTGWVRDDLIDIVGDGSSFGYGVIPQRVMAFRLVRSLGQPPSPQPPPVNPPPASQNPPAAITMARDGVNLRRGPGTVHAAVTRFAYKTRCEILDARQEDNNASRFKWVHLRSNNVTGWVREDYLRYEGDVSSFGLAHADAYPAPMNNAFWVRDWNTDPAFAAIHYGWDFGASVGEPVLAGPGGGQVVQIGTCTACSPARPNVLSNGLRLNDPGVLQSAAWGYGYGNYIVVRYLSDELPASTRLELAKRGLSGYHIFTIYAHLNTINAGLGQSLQPNQLIGTCGNTGNSEAPHLHLEIRAWNNPAETNSGRMIANRLDPVILFRR